MQAKALRAKSLLLAVFALTILNISVLSVSATATYTISHPYSDFNSVTATKRNIPEGNYTAPWRAIVTPSVTWNKTTSTPYMKVHFQNVTDETKNFVSLQFLNTSNLYVIYGVDGDSGQQVGAGTYTMGESVTVYASIDGFRVNNGTVDVVEYFVTMFTIDGSGGAGGVDFSCLSGVVNIKFSSGSEFGLDLVFEMVPLIVAITLLGVVFKAFGKIGKT